MSLPSFKPFINLPKLSSIKTEASFNISYSFVEQLLKHGAISFFYIFRSTGLKQRSRDILNSKL